MSREQHTTDSLSGAGSRRGGGEGIAHKSLQSTSGRLSLIPRALSIESFNITNLQRGSIRNIENWERLGTRPVIKMTIPYTVNY